MGLGSRAECRGGVVDDDVPNDERGQDQRRPPNEVDDCSFRKSGCENPVSKDGWLGRWQWSCGHRQSHKSLSRSAQTSYISPLGRQLFQQSLCLSANEAVGGDDERREMATLLEAGRNLLLA